MQYTIVIKTLAAGFQHPLFAIRITKAGNDDIRLAEILPFGVKIRCGDDVHAGSLCRQYAIPRILDPYTLLRLEACLFEGKVVDLRIRLLLANHIASDDEVELDILEDLVSHGMGRSLIIRAILSIISRTLDEGSWGFSFDIILCSFGSRQASSM